MNGEDKALPLDGGGLGGGDASTASAGLGSHPTPAPPHQGEGKSDFDTPYRGGFVGAEHHFALSVYFEDTDTAGIVYYANYLKFMERARSDMIRAAGVDQVSTHHAGGGAYVVAECHIRYLRPARLGDDLVVVSTVEAVRAVSVLIQQRVMRGDEQLTDARVTAAFLDTAGRPQRQPKEWVERFKAIAAQGENA